MQIYRFNVNFTHRLIGEVGGVFAKGLGNLGSIPDRVIPKSF